MSIMHKLRVQSSRSLLTPDVRVWGTLILATLISIGTEVAATAAENPFGGERITVASTKSYEEVTKAVESLVAKNGMMIIAQVDQGKMLSMTGLTLKATVFLIGNPTVGKELFAQSHGVGLYVPLRLFVYTDPDGKTFVSYDKPSTLLGQFQNEKITMTAHMLDQKLDGLASMAAQ